LVNRNKITDIAKPSLRDLVVEVETHFQKELHEIAGTEIIKYFRKDDRTLELEFVLQFYYSIY